MKNCLRPLPVLLAVAFVGALASCSNPDHPGETNVENGGDKSIVPRETAPPTGGDSAVAGLHRNAPGRPTGEQLYEHADEHVDHNHDGKADH
ncbi:hypothetical protein [Hymenobacter sp. PAMC 26628]|uniref:hypothetical protein n=1 Tax=Hymenobacter sp. PAMC 26628 TaxID=1484118 RepID=UPI00076FE9DE|nr:hypothetical protein [Hymenobacter sp. PAMC 26628]AMJ67164.1 hypothetical protein AXW84_18320 [Hymenobacter sp. PAMC 26628]